MISRTWRWTFLSLFLAAILILCFIPLSVAEEIPDVEVTDISPSAGTTLSPGESVTFTGTLYYKLPAHHSVTEVGVRIQVEGADYSFDYGDTVLGTSFIEHSGSFSGGWMYIDPAWEGKKFQVLTYERLWGGAYITELFAEYPIAEVEDSDGDGVPDDIDLGPDSVLVIPFMPSFTVDEHGCTPWQNFEKIQDMYFQLNLSGKDYGLGAGNGPMVNMKSILATVGTKTVGTID